MTRSLIGIFVPFVPTWNWHPCSGLNLLGIHPNGLPRTSRATEFCAFIELLVFSPWAVFSFSLISGKAPWFQWICSRTPPLDVDLRLHISG